MAIVPFYATFSRDGATGVISAPIGKQTGYSHPIGLRLQSIRLTCLHGTVENDTGPMALKNHIPYKIGITGTIASGKSLVGDILKQAGIPVLDTDKVVAALYEQDKPLITSLATHFGPHIVDTQGKIDKTALRSLVFDNPTEKKWLEAQVHPKVAAQVNAFLADQASDAPIRAVLVPLLVEADTAQRYDEVWAVVVYPEEKLVERLILREGISAEEAKQRLLAQWPQARKAEQAHRIIDNSGTLDETKSQVAQALQAIWEKQAL